MRITDEVLLRWSAIGSTDLSKYGYDFVKKRIENLNFINSNSMLNIK